MTKGFILGAALAAALAIPSYARPRRAMHIKSWHCDYAHRDADRGQGRQSRNGCR